MQILWSFFHPAFCPAFQGKTRPSPARYVTAWFCANSVSLLGASSPNPCGQCGIWSAIIKVETPNARKGDKIITPGRDYKWKNGIQTNFQLTNQYGITPSMSRQGNPHDNAMAENFFSILKTECISRHKPTTFSEANEMIDRYSHFYNYERIQFKTGEAPLARRLSY